MSSTAGANSLLISPEAWELAGPSWRTLRPNRNFDTGDPTDESPEAYHSRITAECEIPLPVVTQWLYPHYNNEDSIRNYGWVDFAATKFELCEMALNELLQVRVISGYQSYVANRSNIESFDSFTCIEADLVHWKNYGTWRVPPIVIAAHEFSQIPSHAEIAGPYQLVEGHTRLAYLKSASKLTTVPGAHTVYMLRPGSS